MRRLNWFSMIGSILLIFCLVFAFNNTADAKKYYSLNDIGLSGCATDNIDYAVLSIRGNTVQYIKYVRKTGSGRWVQEGKSQKAKLSSKTKYYMGNSGRLRNRSADLNTSKWISRVRKGTVKKEYGGRNNEIVIIRGKVMKLVIKLKR